MRNVRNGDVQDPRQEVSSSPPKNRLPVDHTDYRYPPSRNPYWSKLRVEQPGVLSDEFTEKHRGAWRNVFPEAQRIHVELGCNAGHVALEWAAGHPQDAFIGVDWKFKGIARGAEKARKRGLKNLFFLRAHSERLHWMFGEGEIDRLYLFFPDPWPKRAQRKNRIFTAERLQRWASLMKPGGTFEIRTDHRGYFEAMLQAIEKSNSHWQILEQTWDRHCQVAQPQDLEIPEVTLFEKLFIAQNLPIHAVTLQVRAPLPKK